MVSMKLQFVPKSLLLLFCVFNVQFSWGLGHGMGNKVTRDVSTRFLPQNLLQPLTTRAPGKKSTKLQCNSNAANVATLMRGGNLSPKFTSSACSAVLAVNGVAQLLFPKKLPNLYNVEPDDGRAGDLANYFIRACGVAGIGVAITLYMSILKKSTVRVSVGLGLLPRLVFFLGSIVKGTLADLDMTTPFYIFNTVVTCWTTVALLFDIGNPAVSARIFSCMATLKALKLVVSPGKTCSKFLGVDVDKKVCGQPFANVGMEKAKAVSRGLGNELLTSAFLMGCLAFGVDPVKAAGYTSIFWSLLLIDMAFLDKTWRLMGSEGPRAQIVHICISLAFAVGFLF